ncbi:MAG: pyridoxal phosphate-dependent aminotransferase [Acidobacteria bacterium]|nr:pyridoxal phosphate-dependent aminotransferase [Acidobacteriota bacterium]
MGTFLDSIPLSGIVRIRDMMYTVANPFRLDQGDISFDAPDTVKQAMIRAVEENRTHYLPTTGVPRLRQLAAEKLRVRNGIPVESDDEILITNGGTHGVYAACQALLEPGDEVIVPDPEWPPTMAMIRAAHGEPVAVPLHESDGWRWNLDELERALTPKTKAIYINSPNNPTGGLLTRSDLERIAAMARERSLWVFSDEAYEDIVFDGHHMSIASLPGMYERTIPVYTMSKTYAVTGVRVGYLAIKDPTVRARAIKVVLYTTSNVSSIAQYGAIGALEGSQDAVVKFRDELRARRDLFYEGLPEASGGIFSGAPPAAAFYAFVRIDPAWRPDSADQPSQSWGMAEHLIAQGRIGCVPGADFGPSGEGHMRFCFGRERAELSGALESMRSVLAPHHVRAR